MAERLCSAHIEADHPNALRGTAATMRSDQYDPFGEPVTQTAFDDRPNAASRIALRSGVTLFWALVVGIVVARAVYFDPGFAEKFQGVAALMKHLQAIVGV